MMEHVSRPGNVHHRDVVVDQEPDGPASFTHFLPQSSHPALHAPGTRLGAFPIMNPDPICSQQARFVPEVPTGLEGSIQKRRQPA